MVSSTAQVPADRLLSFPDACTYLGVRESWLRRAVLQHQVRHYKLGKFLRFDPGDLDRLLLRGPPTVP